MNNLKIEGDSKSPTIDLNYETGVLEIKGRSWPEHAVNIYEPAFKWLEEYKNSPKPNTIVKVALEYFNTSSSKVVLAIFKKLEELHGKGTEVKVEWYYEKDDFDLKDEGTTMKELVKVPVELIGIDEFDFTF